jgi:hypothetical protein
VKGQIYHAMVQYLMDMCKYIRLRGVLIDNNRATFLVEIQTGWRGGRFGCQDKTDQQAGNEIGNGIRWGFEFRTVTLQ